MPEDARYGDPAVWEALHDQYHQQAVSWVRARISANPHLCEDIVQMAWASVALYVQSGQPVKNFDSLFYTMIRRRLVDEYRRWYRSPETLTLDAPVNKFLDDRDRSKVELLQSPEPGPVHALLTSERQATVQAAVSTLSPRYQAVIHARITLGMTCPQSAGYLIAHGLLDGSGEPWKKAENYYYRALAQLRTILDPELLSA